VGGGVGVPPGSPSRTPSCSAPSPGEWRFSTRERERSPPPPPRGGRGGGRGAGLPHPLPPATPPPPSPLTASEGHSEGHVRGRKGTGGREGGFCSGTHRTEDPSPPPHRCRPRSPRQHTPQQASAPGDGGPRGPRRSQRGGGRPLRFPARPHDLTAFTHDSLDASRMYDGVGFQ